MISKEDLVQTRDALQSEFMQVVTLIDQNGCVYDGRIAAIMPRRDHDPAARTLMVRLIDVKLLQGPGGEYLWSPQPTMREIVNEGRDQPAAPDTAAADHRIEAMTARVRTFCERHGIDPKHVLSDLTLQSNWHGADWLTLTIDLTADEADGGEGGSRDRDR